MLLDRMRMKTMCSHPTGMIDVQVTSRRLGDKKEGQAKSSWEGLDKHDKIKLLKTMDKGREREVHSWAQPKPSN